MGYFKVYYKYISSDRFAWPANWTHPTHNYKNFD